MTLGGVTLTAHLTPGHTRGCTSWTTAVQEGGKTYNVLFGCSLRPPGVITPAIEAEFRRAFKVFRALPCDIQLGDHGAQYGMHAKYAKLQGGGESRIDDSWRMGSCGAVSGAAITTIASATRRIAAINATGSWRRRAQTSLQS